MLFFKYLVTNINLINVNQSVFNLKNKPITLKPYQWSVKKI